MTLAEFLSTANPDHNLALAEARAFNLSKGLLIEASTVNGVLTDLDLIDVVKDIAENKEHPARRKMLGVYTALLGNHQFNFIQSSLTGQRALAQLNWLIDTGVPEHAEVLSQFRDLMLWRSSALEYPFANTTLHDVLIVREACPWLVVPADGSFVVITTTANCEKHNPRLMALNPRTGNWQRINNFMGVELAGRYETSVPLQFKGWQLKVDNAYGVF